MLLNSQLLIIFIILILHLLVIFLLKSRATMIAVVMISHLTIILFYSLIISNPQTLKEFIIAIIIYTTTLLALIANSKHIHNISKYDLKRNRKFIVSIILIIICAIVISSGIFYLIKNIDEAAHMVKEQQIAKKMEIERNPLIFPGHLVHVNVKKYYLEANSDNKNFHLNVNKSNDFKELHSKHGLKKLQENVVFKRSSDLIIIISGIITILLINFRYKNH